MSTPTLNKQIWIKQLLTNFYPEATFLNYARNFDSLVEYDIINLAEAGLDPKVLINNTTYPINVVERQDKPISLELDLFETENTLVRYPDEVERSYDKMESVLYGHRMTLQSGTQSKAAHAYAPSEDSENTPVLTTSGEVNDYGFKMITIKDILKLKTRYDLLNYPAEGRCLVLDPRHTEDLILQDSKSFKDITDFVNGKPKRMLGFNIMEYTNNPKYVSDTMEKAPFDTVTPNLAYSTFSFHTAEVMKAEGSNKMYETKDDPRLRASIVGFDKRFIALPLRNKGIGAIVALKP